MDSDDALQIFLCLAQKEQNSKYDNDNSIKEMCTLVGMLDWHAQVS